jgi:hypothetical protein
LGKHTDIAQPLYRRWIGRTSCIFRFYSSHPGFRQRPLWQLSPPQGRPRADGSIDSIPRLRGMESAKSRPPPRLATTISASCTPTKRAASAKACPSIFRESTRFDADSRQATGPPACAHVVPPRYFSVKIYEINNLHRVWLRLINYS